MLEWTAAGDGARLMMLVFHDDADREYSYGPPANITALNFQKYDIGELTESDENAN